jgi:hypothetical protein
VVDDYNLDSPTVDDPVLESISSTKQPEYEEPLPKKSKLETTLIRGQSQGSLPAHGLGRKREKPISIGSQLVNCAERLISASSAVDTSAVERAVFKLRSQYKSKPGWEMDDLLVGYGLFENSVKAEVFLGMDAGEDQDKWLRREIEKYQVEKL